MGERGLIAVRHLRAGDRVIRVEISRNEGGSVAARCRLGAGDAPIIDGPSEDEVLAAVADALEGLLLARAPWRRLPSALVFEPGLPAAR